MTDFKKLPLRKWTVRQKMSYVRKHSPFDFWVDVAPRHGSKFFIIYISSHKQVFHSGYQVGEEKPIDAMDRMARIISNGTKNRAESKHFHLLIINVAYEMRLRKNRKRKKR